MPINPHIDAILRERFSGRRKVPKLIRRQEPRGLERAYLSDIIKLIEPARELVDELLVARLPEFDSELAINDTMRADAYPDELERIFGDIKLRYGQIVSAGDVTSTASSQASQIDLFNREQTARQFKRVLGIDVFALTPQLTTEISAFTVDNVGLIESIPQRYLDEVENTALRNLRAGNRSPTWQHELRERYDVTESRAALIARDQTNKFNGELNRARQTSLGIEGYTWRTAGDERVRPTHEAIDGNVYAWSGRPAPPEGHPGQPIQCRCQAEPDVEAALERLGV